MLYSSQDGTFKIDIPLNVWELLGRINSSEPLMLNGPEGPIIFEVLKLEYNHEMTSLYLSVLSKYGELKSSTSHSYLILQAENRTA